MNTFRIYKHPDGRLVAVKVGFSFPGAIFGAFWLLWHQIWILGGITAAIGLGLYFVFPNPEGYIMGIPYGHRFGVADVLNIAICVIVGVLGNEWRRGSLAERGFDNVSEERAETADGAKAEYLRDPGRVVVFGASNERKEPHF